MKSIFSFILLFIAQNIFAIVGISGGSCSPAGGSLAGFSGINATASFATSSGNLLYNTEQMKDYKVRGACPETETKGGKGLHWVTVVDGKGLALK